MTVSASSFRSIAPIRSHTSFPSIVQSRFRSSLRTGVPSGRGAGLLVALVLGLAAAAGGVTLFAPAAAIAAESPFEGMHTALDRAHNQCDLKQAASILEQFRPGNEQNAEWLWEKARYEFEVGSQKGLSSSTRNAAYNRALALAQQAMAADPRSGPAHGWYAFILGQMLMAKGPEEQIKQAYVVRDHLTQAISLSPNRAEMYLALGRWHYELSELGWVSRKLAAALFATPPEGDLNEGARLLQKAVTLDPDNLMAWLYLARSQQKLGNDDAARLTVRRALARPVRPREVPASVDLKKLNSSF